MEYGAQIDTSAEDESKIQNTDIGDGIGSIALV
jgi:hypothetical protein